MVAKSIYYKGNKVVKTHEVPVDIIGFKPQMPTQKTLDFLSVGRCFEKDGAIWIKTNQTKENHIYVVNLSNGAMNAMLAGSLVTEKNTVLKVE